MSLWVTHTEMMARTKRRREAVTKALIDAGIIINDSLVVSASADFYEIPHRGRTIRCLSLKGLEQIAKHCGIEVPR